jgi:broad-specificity NMP kinase
MKITENWMQETKDAVLHELLEEREEQIKMREEAENRIIENAKRIAEKRNEAVMSSGRKV